nr:hypothetical protein [uncultured Flavobacterium sp.]
MGANIREQALALCNRDIRLQLDVVNVHLLSKENKKALKEYKLLEEKMAELKKHLITLYADGKQKKFKVEIHQKPEPRRKDSFWFDGHVATVTNGKTTVNIVALGRIDVFFNPNESSMTNDDARKEARKRGYTDKKLTNICKHDGFSNSNWFTFEVFIYGEATMNEHTDINFNDAIAYAKSLLNNL